MRLDDDRTLTFPDFVGNYHFNTLGNMSELWLSAMHFGMFGFLCALLYRTGKSKSGTAKTFHWGINILLGGLSLVVVAYLMLGESALYARGVTFITTDWLAAIVAVILVVEFARRTSGWVIPVMILIALSYVAWWGKYLTGVFHFPGLTAETLLFRSYFSNEGMFGSIARISSTYVYMFILFGAFLVRSGAGEFIIELARCVAGRMIGGPGLVAVLGSSLMGSISGSAVANTVSTGVITIPMMKRVGFTSEKAGAVEVASSVNGQIMPPVMGAAAFLMVEYVGISYVQVITHAFLPALISYLALIYIVHLEALKQNMQGLPRRAEVKAWHLRLIGMLTGFLLTCGMAAIVYYGIGWIKPAFGAYATLVISVLLVAAYAMLVKIAANVPDLKLDDPNEPMVQLPEVAPTVKSGLHFLLPVVVLVWCLMVERLSPGLSAFWATVLMIAILLTQRPLIAFFRGETALGEKVRQGFNELVDGLITGARNMIGIGIATATAGIIVGAVSQTGVGSVLADLVEVLSMGNLLLMLILIAVLSLILGMGLPTTANYIVVSSLLAPVVITLGQEAGLIVPLIAVHLFVFYFGIMADVTPPVGLASFAAAAVSGGDPIRTGFVAFAYSLRTAALPFLFIFNTDLLLIDVTWVEGIQVFIISTIAMLVFTAATQGYFFSRSRLYESALLLLVAFSLFRPGFWWDEIYPPVSIESPTQIEALAAEVPPGGNLMLQAEGMTIDGDQVSKLVKLPLEGGGSGAERLSNAGLMLNMSDDKVVVDMVGFGSPAQEAGLDFDWEIQGIQVENERPDKQWMMLPALALLAGLAMLQLQRRRKQAAAENAAA